MGEWPQGIPDEITREDVLQAAADFDGGEEHNFGPSTSYDVVVEDGRYPPKAIVGLAARRLAGRALSNWEFSGGRASKCFRMGATFTFVELCG